MRTTSRITFTPIKSKTITQFPKHTKSVPAFTYKEAFVVSSNVFRLSPFLFLTADSVRMLFDDGPITDSRIPDQGTRRTAVTDESEKWGGL